jgi:phospholipid/cholesterol/gamma-HCH transport system ATP-binding protein
VATAALELRNISVSFGHEIILSNINFSVAKEECVVLVGPSGTGKSSILKLLAGLIQPMQGQVFIEGYDINAIPERERTRLLLKVGMLFQKNALFDSLKVGENIAFPLRETTALTEKQITKCVDDFLAAVGLAQAKDLYPDEISGGMQKRLGIARALALEPAIILYDDPTAGLDPITSRKIIEVVISLKQKNKCTALVITNDMARAFQLADRMIMVVDKGLIITGNKEQTFRHSDPRVHQFVRGELKGPLKAIL